MNENQTFRELFKSARGELGYKLDGVILEITEQIMEQMKAEDISKSELAVRLQTSAPYVTKVLRGETNFTAESIVKIADALKCDVEVRLIPRTNVAGWIHLVEKSGELRREFQVWSQAKDDARAYRAGMKSAQFPTSSQYCYHLSH